MKNRAGHLAVCLVQGIKGHDLHGQDGGRKFLAAKDMNQGFGLHKGKTGKIGGQGIEQRRKARHQPAHGCNVLLAPGNG